MRVLILSCNTGGGHNSTGMAIKAYFEAQNVTCDVYDALSFWSARISKFISGGHVFIYRNLPRLFGVGYRYEEKSETRFLYDLFAKSADNLYQFIVDGEYTHVICVHSFSAMTLTEVRRKYHPNIHTSFVATDYTCSPGVSVSDLDLYFIPHEKLTDEFVRQGIPREKIIPSGIPVHPYFFLPTNKKSIRSLIDVPKSGKVIMLSCGSMGAGPMRRLAFRLKNRLAKNEYLVIICGTNEKLFRYLTFWLRHDRVRILSFSKNMYDLMAASDLLITKPGGISTTEAAIRRLPFVSLNAVPGCETRNLDFFLSIGVTKTAKGVRGIADLAFRILRSPEERAALRSALETEFAFNPGATVCKTLLALNDTQNPKE